MGCKKLKAVVLLIVCLLGNSITSHAGSAQDIYEYFGLSYSVEYSDDVIKTIESYQYAQKYEHMFQYVNSMPTDTALLSKQLSEAERDLQSVSSDLSNGYFLTLSEIYHLENEYVRLSKLIEELKLKLISYTVEYKTPTLENTPSYSDYIAACNDKATTDSNARIGPTDIPLDAPVASTWLIQDTTESTITFKVAAGTSVSSLWKGNVISVDADKVIIDCNCGILIGYSGLSTITVKVGDTVFDGQYIGTASSVLLLKLSLDGNFVDVAKLF